MTKIKEKLLVASKDEDALKVLEQFGLTKDLIEGYEELEKPATLDEAIKNFNLQSDLDKKLNKAIQTREDNLKAKYDFVEKEQKQEKEDPETGNPALDALMKKLSALETKLEAQEKEKEKLTLKQKQDNFITLLRSKNIPAIYGSKFDPEKGEEEQLEVIQKEFEKDFEPLAPKKGFKLPNPNRGGEANGPSKKEMEEFKQYI